MRPLIASIALFVFFAPLSTLSAPASAPGSSLSQISNDDLSSNPPAPQTIEPTISTSEQSTTHPDTEAVAKRAPAKKKAHRKAHKHAKVTHKSTSHVNQQPQPAVKRPVGHDTAGPPIVVVPVPNPPPQPKPTPTKNTPGDPIFLDPFPNRPRPPPPRPTPTYVSSPVHGQRFGDGPNK